MKKSLKKGGLPKAQNGIPLWQQLTNQALNSAGTRDQVASTAYPQVSQAVIKKKQNEREQNDIKTYGSVERANQARAIAQQQKNQNATLRLVPNSNISGNNQFTNAENTENAKKIVKGAMIAVPTAIGAAYLAPVGAAAAIDAVASNAAVNGLNLLRSGLSAGNTGLRYIGQGLRWSPFNGPGRFINFGNGLQGYFGYQGVQELPEWKHSGEEFIDNPSWKTALPFLGHTGSEILNFHPAFHAVKELKPFLAGRQAFKSALKDILYINKGETEALAANAALKGGKFLTEQATHKFLHSLAEGEEEYEGNYSNLWDDYKTGYSRGTSPLFQPESTGINKNLFQFNSENKKYGGDQYGGEHDIDKVYEIMKRGGYAKNARKKNAEEWDKDSFQDYMMKVGGPSLPKYDLTGPVTNTSLVGNIADPTGNKDWTYSYNNGAWSAYNKGKMYDISKNPKFKSSVDKLNAANPTLVNPNNTGAPANNTGTTTTNPGTNNTGTTNTGTTGTTGAGTTPAGNTGTSNTGTGNTSANPYSKQYGPGVDSHMYLNLIASQSRNKAGLLPAMAAAVNLGSALSDSYQGYAGLFGANKKKTPTTPLSIEQQTVNKNAKTDLKKEVDEYQNHYLREEPTPEVDPLAQGDFLSGLETGYPTQGIQERVDWSTNKRGGGSIYLHKAEFGEPVVGSSAPQLNLSQPAGSFNTWNVDNSSIQSNPGFQAVQNANQNATRIADPNNSTVGAPGPGSGSSTTDATNPQNKNESDKKKQNGPPKFNTQQAFAGVSKLASVGNFLGAVNDAKERDDWNSNTSEQINPQQGATDYGNYSTNATQGTNFRPNQMQYTQNNNRGLLNQNLMNAAVGGSIWDKYEDGAEVDINDLTYDDILKIYASGGTIDYI